MNPILKLLLKINFNYLNLLSDTMTIRTNKELKREYLSELDRIVLVEQSRQMYLGE